MMDATANLLTEAVLGAGQANRDATQHPRAAGSAIGHKQELVRRLRSGEAAAFDEVVALYHDRVRRLATRLLGWPAAADIDDVVQEVFVAVLENAGRFRGGSTLTTWLTVITLNKCRTRRRSLRSWLSMLSRAKERTAPEPSAADAGAIRAETRRRVREAIASLPPRDREVIVLHYLEHHTTTEMAEILGVKPNALEVRLHRARQRLKPRLSDLVDESE